MPRTPKSLVQVADLGKLEKFPREVISMILGHLDIRTAARFAKVSLKARLLMKSNKYYRHLSHCLFTLLSVRACLNLSDTQMFFQNITPQELSDKMLRPCCVVCGASKTTYRVHVEFGWLCCQSHKMNPNVTQYIQLKNVNVALRRVEKYKVALNPFTGKVEEFTENQLQRLLLRVEKNKKITK
ncbi:hypothetical protein F4776DRAFT_427962 [Hypoxylon sp. NC0597]|nr:hypothetical protein F4776DRAFT_427962 [Hypoxylon sp. NC0597]